jgi:hypothetical protein
MTSDWRSSTFCARTTLAARTANSKDFDRAHTAQLASAGLKLFAGENVDKPAIAVAPTTGKHTRVCTGATDGR